MKARSTACISALVFSLMLPICASAQFTPVKGSPFPAGSAPDAMVAGDFNRDGIQDIAVANSTSNNLTVLLGDPWGGFRQAHGSPYPVGSHPRSIAVGDFNRDLIEDLAVANTDDNTVTVLLGDGRGGFQQASGSPFATGPASEPISGGGPWAIAVGDFNRDGKLDLVTANQGGNSVTVFFGAGNGTFSLAPGSPFSVPGFNTGITVADFNRDGRLDLAVISVAGPVTLPLSDTVDVLLGNGDGTFTTAPGSPFPAGVDPQGITSGDFNGDGFKDIAVANMAQGIAVFLNDGKGGFSPGPGSPYPSSDGPFAITTGDFNGDRIEDLATANIFGNDVTVLLGDGTGAFTPAPGSPYPAGSQPQAIAAGYFRFNPFDHFHRQQDLAVANFGSNDVTVLLSSPSVPCVHAPRDLHVWRSQANPNSQIDLAWTDGSPDSSNNESGFEIFRSVDFGKTFGRIGSVSSGNTSWEDTGLEPGHAYSYYIKAVDSCGSSSPSNLAAAVTGGH